MRASERSSGAAVGAYTTADDFCRIFTEDMKRLYLLSFVLTANHDMAAQCFESAMKECMHGSPIFKQWAAAWTRRVIIKNALQIVFPNTRPESNFQAKPGEVGENLKIDEPFAAVIRLLPFERFVFVMSLLEKYSDHECSIFLNTTRAQIQTVRTMALQNLATDGKPLCWVACDSVLPEVSPLRTGT